MLRSYVRVKPCHSAASNRVLFYSEGWGSGGIETFVMNVVRRLDRREFGFDIYSTHDNSNLYDGQIKRFGGGRYTIFPDKRPNQVIRLIAGVRGFANLIKNGDYSIVHINTMNGMGLLYAMVAARCGVKVRVVHSHNDDVGDGFKTIKRLIGKIGRVLFGKYATSRIACSESAGEYLFGEYRFRVINNGVDVDRFAFKKEIREAVRREYGLNCDAPVIGSLARLSSQKNPLFQLDIFKKFSEDHPSARYLMLNHGEMLGEVEKHIRDLGLNSKVILISPTTTPEAVLFSLDAMLFPSRFEGLGYVAIEAQCTGLPVLASDVVPKETRVTNLIEYLSLEQPPHEWADKLEGMLGSFDRTKYANLVRNSGFDSSLTTMEIIELYRKLIAT